MFVFIFSNEPLEVANMYFRKTAPRKKKKNIGLHFALRPCFLPLDFACFEYGVEYTSPTLTIVNPITTVNDCQKECQQAVGCMGFGWNSVAGNCNLRDGITPKSYGRAGFISGPVNCPD